jgi:hypothetical protein
MDFATTLAYLGPETMLPMTSVIAGAVGVMMLFGRNALRWAGGLLRLVKPGARSRSKSNQTARVIGQGPIGTIRRPSAAKARQDA